MTTRETPPPCAGVVLFTRDPPAGAVLLVQDHHGHWGFPKGKRDRGEGVRDNALRELREETGLVPDDIDLVDGAECDERSERGNLAVRYLAAWARDPSKPLALADDEHLAVAWVPCDVALSRLRPSRRAVLDALRARLAAA